MSCPLHPDAPHPPRIEVSLALLRSQLVAHPNDMWNHLGEVYALNRLGRHQEALDRTYLLSEAWPGFQYAYAARSSTCLDLGRVEEALKAADQALALFGRNPNILTTHGQALEAAGRYEQALSRYLTGVQLEPGYPPGHRNGMRVAHRLGLWGTVLTSTRALVTRNPGGDITAARILVRCLLEREGSHLALDLFSTTNWPPGLARELFAELLLAVPEVADQGHPLWTSASLSGRACWEAWANLAANQPATSRRWLERARQHGADDPQVAVLVAALTALADRDAQAFAQALARIPHEPRREKP